jgi:serine/threonine protein kinase
MINRKNPFLQPTVFDPSTHTHGTTATSTTTTTAIPRITTTMAPPITEVMVLQLFLQICRGVQALHTCGYSHRDIKIENVMIASSSSSSSWQPSKSKFQSNSPSLQQTQQHPVPHLLLMDFGSAGPIEMTIHHRKQILQIVELASQHTTMPYRPPELLEGGIRWHPTNNTTTATTLTTTAVGNNTNTITNTNTPTNNTNTMILDYSAVDVWSLGCTLHAIMYGASPFECEFNIASSNVTSRHYTTTSVSANSTSTIGNIKIVDCTHLSILGNIPVPKHLPISSWYSASIRNDLLLPMLRQEPQQRPKLPTIIQTIEQMIVQLGGSVISDMPSLVESDSANTNNFFYETEHRPYRDNVNNDNNDDADADADGIALLNRMA